MSIKTPHNVELSSFSQRLRAAFKDARDAEIARLLGYRSQSPIAKWFEGTYPSAEVLLKVAQITKVNLHWLLTGEGEVTTERFHFLGEPMLGPLWQMAELRQQSLEEVVRFLVRQAMLARCTYLIEKIDALEPDELVELRALVALFTDDPELSAAAVANLQRRA